MVPATQSVRPNSGPPLPGQALSSRQVFWLTCHSPPHLPILVDKRRDSGLLGHRLRLQQRVRTGIAPVFLFFLPDT